MNRALSTVRIAMAWAAVATVVAGCTAANNATSAQAQAEQPSKTMYGLTSEGPSTDLYTEFFGPRQPPAAPATAVASAQPVQPIAAQPAAPAQPNAAPTSPARAGQTAASANRPNQLPATTANRAPQPLAVQPAPVQVAQQPAPPPPPQEPDVPTAYGIPSSGPTTDLYTALFGRRDSR